MSSPGTPGPSRSRCRSERRAATPWSAPAPNRISAAPRRADRPACRPTPETAETRAVRTSRSSPGWPKPSPAAARTSATAAPPADAYQSAVIATLNDWYNDIVSSEVPAGPQDDDAANTAIRAGIGTMCCSATPTTPASPTSTPLRAVNRDRDRHRPVPGPEPGDRNLHHHRRGRHRRRLHRHRPDVADGSRRDSGADERPRRASRSSRTPTTTAAGRTSRWPARTRSG